MYKPMADAEDPSGRTEDSTEILEELETPPLTAARND
jgi:hypothetical protein